jgi:hypothetical protein
MLIFLAHSCQGAIVKPLSHLGNGGQDSDGLDFMRHHVRRAKKAPSHCGSTRPRENTTSSDALIAKTLFNALVWIYSSIGGQRIMR